MQLTFTRIKWRNEEDSSIFNLHALKEITLDGMKQGIITIKGASSTFKAPYCDLTFGGGFTHFELKTKHPYEQGAYLYIAIFDEKVAIANCESVDAWFEYKCRTYVADF